MTNTNLMRCGRGPLFHSRGLVTGPADPVLGDDLPGQLSLVGPWSVRLRTGRRAAMEVYEHGELLDVVVESGLSRALLRGARRSRGGGPEPTACAWGRLPSCGAAPTVGFLGGGLRRRAETTAEVRSSGPFWFASATGRFRWVRAQPAACCAEHVELGRAA
ncbi:hypothetical protein AB0K51_32400 [Kitasatospora sp. NPDC049285]|uniref:hypothetical protein n=1 Tax=Kitasatospora sp. NPDC049285 TaxID=3157096 RepID=UPI00343270D8